MRSCHSYAVPARNRTPNRIVSNHQTRNAVRFRDRERSARWMLTLLKRRQHVVPMVRGRDRTAGGGPVTSLPRKLTYVTISVLKKATSDSRKATMPHCGGFSHCSGETDGGTGSCAAASDAGTDASISCTT